MGCAGSPGTPYRACDVGRRVFSARRVYEGGHCSSNKRIAEKCWFRYKTAQAGFFQEDAQELVDKCGFLPAQAQVYLAKQISRKKFRLMFGIYVRPQQKRCGGKIC